MPRIFSLYFNFSILNNSIIGFLLQLYVWGLSLCRYVFQQLQSTDHSIEQWVAAYIYIIYKALVHDHNSVHCGPYICTVHKGMQHNGNIKSI